MAAVGDVPASGPSVVAKVTTGKAETPEPEPEKVTATKNFRTLRLRTSKRSKNTVTLKWQQNKKADGYQIYGCVCGGNRKLKLLKTIKNRKTTSWTHKKLEEGTFYKYQVVAYKNVKGKKRTLNKSVVVDAPTKGGKTTVAKGVMVNKPKVTLKKKETFQIKASEVKDEEKKKNDQHRKLRYESSNPNIATVNQKGKVKGVKKGKAKVFVYAETGAYSTVKVTVK